jgi:hypothetical protein
MGCCGGTGTHARALVPRLAGRRRGCCSLLGLVCFFLLPLLGVVRGVAGAVDIRGPRWRAAASCFVFTRAPPELLRAVSCR